MDDNKALVQLQFEGRQIRRIMDAETGEWWYAVADVVEALTDSTKPRNYWYDLKRREKVRSGIELSDFCRQFRLKASNNRFYDTDCANTEGMLRIIQSIPSPKAEPFKRWLAEVGAERLDEIENPELAAERLRQIYKVKGYSDEWIERRLQSIVTRKEGALPGMPGVNWRRKRADRLFLPPITWNGRKPNRSNYRRAWNKGWLVTAVSWRKYE